MTGPQIGTKFFKRDRTYTVHGIRLAESLFFFRTIATVRFAVVTVASR
jgi:hypothetical protein